MAAKAAINPTTVPNAMEIKVTLSLMLHLTLEDMFQLSHTESAGPESLLKTAFLYDHILCW